MHGVFSKSSRIHGRCCKACRNMTKLGRRQVTTVSTPPAAGRTTSKAAAQAQAFTALYTSLFATVAIVDAKRKGERRRDLDAHINETRDAVAQLQVENGTAADPNINPDCLGLEEVAAAVNNDGVATAYRIGLGVDVPIKTRLWKKHGGELWGLFHDPDVRFRLRKIDEKRIFQGLRKYGGETPSSQNLMAERTKVRELVQKLLQQVVNENVRKHMTPESSAKSPSPLRIAIDRLLEKGYPRFKHSGPTRVIGSEWTASKRRHTRISFDALDDMVHDVRAVSKESHCPSRMIEHLCYNLLTSIYAPTRHTYHTLIMHLQHPNYQVLARDILLTVFRHYINHNWETQVAALTLDRRLRNTTFAMKNIRFILRFSRRYNSPSFRFIVECMLNCFIGFEKLRESVSLVCQTGAASFQMHTLMRLLSWIIFRLDEPSAMSMLKHFIQNEGLRDFLENMSEAHMAEAEGSLINQGILVHQLTYLLDICGLWQNPRRLEDRLAAYGIGYVEFAEFRSRLRVLNISNQIAWMGKVVKSVETRLENKLWDLAADCAPWFNFALETRMPRSWLSGEWFEDVKKGKLEGDMWRHEDHRTARWKLREASVAHQVHKANRKAVALTVEVAQAVEEWRNAPKEEGNAAFLKTGVESVTEPVVQIEPALATEPEPLREPAPFVGMHYMPSLRLVESERGYRRRPMEMAVV